MSSSSLVYRCILRLSHPYTGSRVWGHRYEDKLGVVIGKGPGNQGLHSLLRLHSNVVPGSQKPEPKVSTSRHSPSPPDYLVMRKKPRDTCSWRDRKDTKHSGGSRTHSYTPGIHSQDVPGVLRPKDKTRKKMESFEMRIELQCQETESSRDDGGSRRIFMDELHAPELRHSVH